MYNSNVHVSLEGNQSSPNVAPTALPQMCNSTQLFSTNIENYAHMCASILSPPDFSQTVWETAMGGDCGVHQRSGMSNQIVD